MLLDKLNTADLDEALVNGVLFDGLDYDGQSADLIMVLGSKKAHLYRMPKAAELYLSGKARKILLSGGGAVYADREKITECESMRRVAVSMGIPDENIMREESSENTAENFRFCERLLESDFSECEKIILVTCDFHMRRAMLIAEHEMPQRTIISCPVSAGRSCKTEWYKTRHGINRIKNELNAIAALVRDGIADNKEI